MFDDYTPTVTATITGVGADSRVPDRPDAVDAVVALDGRVLGECTLLSDHDHDLTTFGSCPDHWADDELRGYLEQVAAGDTVFGSTAELVWWLVGAVREALADYQLAAA